MKTKAIGPGIVLLSLFFLAGRPARGADEIMQDFAWNMPAMTVSLPEGWGGEYEISHLGSGDFDLTYAFQDTVTGQWMQKFPRQRFFYAEASGFIPPEVVANLSATPMMKPMNAEEVVQVFIDSRFGGNAEVTPIPLTRQERADLEKGLPPPQNFRTNLSSLNQEVIADGTNAMVEYDRDGTLFRERISCFVISLRARFIFSFPAYSEIATTEWFVIMGLAGGRADLFEDPDDETVKAIFASMKQLPQWTAALASERDAAQREIVRKSNADMASSNAAWKSVMDTQNEIAQSRQKVLNNRFEAQSNAFNNMTDVIAGREAVQNPYGGQIYIDYSKNHAWVDSNGNLRYSDSSLYDPNQEPGSSGSYRQIR